MNPRMIAIVMLYLAGFCLGIAGVVSIVDSGSYGMDHYQASRLTTNGYVLLAFGSTFFVTASILAFIAGARRTPQDGEGKK